MITLCSKTFIPSKRANIDAQLHDDLTLDVEGQIIT
jgi:hypothetical protein